MHHDAPPVSIDTQNHNEQGAALIVAILLLLIVSIIGVTTANRAMLEERMASNQYVQTNSFLAAEAGLTAARQIADSDTVRQAVATGNAETIENAWREAARIYENWHALDSTASDSEFKLATLDQAKHYWNTKQNQFDVVSHGRAAAGTRSASWRTLGLSIKPAQQASFQGTSPFTSALVGLEGFSAKYGARVDTYNSAYGAYNESILVDGKPRTNSTSSENSADLESISTRTCAPAATITLSGDSPIYGDVLGTGDLVSDTGTTVHGNIRVNGDVDFNGHVDGALVAGGNVTLGSASAVGGLLIAGGNVTMEGGATDKPPAIKAGGTIVYPSYYQASLTDQYVGNLSAAELNIEPVEGDGAGCVMPEQTEITQRFTAVRNDSKTQPFVDWLEADGCSAGACYRQTQTDLILKGYGNGSDNVFSIGSPGQTTQLELNGRNLSAGSLAELDIHGFVTLLIDGDFDLGGRTILKVGAEDTLTLLITGQTTFGLGSNTAVTGRFVRPGKEGRPTPAIALYSMYSGTDPGVTINGSNDSYLAVYTPNSGVRIGNSGDLYGSVVAKTIDMSGYGDIHYDQALKNIATGAAGGSGSSSGSAAPQSSSATWHQVLDY